jgi:hypothetical protein
MPSFVCIGTMKHEDLAPEAQAHLATLQTEMLRILALPSPHLTALTYSSMEDGTTEEDSITGTELVAPSKPFLNYDEHPFCLLHQAVFHASQGALYSIVIHAARSSLEAAWQLRTKLLSRTDHAAIVLARKPIDATVKLELEKFKNVPDWEYSSFGRDLPGKDAGVFTRTKSEKLRPTPNEALYESLQAAEALYAANELDLKIAQWTQRKNEVTFQEYFE